MSAFSRLAQWSIPVLLFSTTLSTTARAEPRKITLDEATRMFRERGYDVALAKMDVGRAEADVKTAGTVLNPLVTIGYGRTFGYDNNLQGCSGCSANTYSAALSDQGTLTQVIFGKRGTRMDAAERSLDATKAQTTANVRSLELQLKDAYVDAWVARALLAFAMDVQASTTKTLEIQRIRFPKVIDEGTLARFETVKLQAEQAADVARIEADNAARRLGVMLGVDPTTEISVEEKELDYRVPTALEAATEASLLTLAHEHRAELEAARKGKEAADLGLTAAKRQRVPDLALSVQYLQTGTGTLAIQPPTLMFGITAPIPVFYQQQGEVRRAEVEQSSQAIISRRTINVVDAEVRTAFASFSTTRGMVERFQKSTLDRARRAEEVIALQYNAGSATLIDLLDAQRVSVSTKADYLRTVGDYWARVFQLEQAVGTPFH